MPEKLIYVVFQKKVNPKKYKYIGLNIICKYAKKKKLI